MTPPLDLDDAETHLLISQSSSEVLATQVVVYRSLGLNKTLALLSMAELARRRDLGEEFNYENFIEEELKKIPKIESFDVAGLSKNIKSNIHSFTETMKKKV
jgi:hypothetical protein